MSRLSRIAVGSVQFGERYGVANPGVRVSEAQARAILTRAKGMGIRTVDTAAVYGDSEQLLGRYGMSDWCVIGKLPAAPLSCPDVHAWTRETVVESLQKLRIDHLDALLLHRPDQLDTDQGPDILATLRQLQREGMIGKIGISIYQPSQLDRLMAIHDFEVVQAPASIIDHRLHKSGWPRKLAERGCELHVRSIFLQGLLLAPAVQQHRFPQQAEIWRIWDAWLRDTGLSALQACLRHALALPDVDKVVVGFDSLAQFQAMTQAVAGPLPEGPCWPQEVAPELLDPSRWSASWP